MASPFYYFRKHQKAFLAIAAVLAMVIFVFADAMMGWVREPSGPRNANKTLVTWNGGSITGQELEYLRQRRFFVSQFLANLQMAGEQKILQDGGTPSPPSVPSFLLPRGANSRQVEVGCVTTRIYAQLAKQAGMTISDEVINHYLAEIGHRRMSDQDIAMLLQNMSRGDVRSAEQRLFSGLRELLLGNTYISSFSSAERTILPEERWQDWLRVNERIAVEAAVLPAAEFVSKVDEPTDAEVTALYEEFKDNLGGMIHSVMNIELPSPHPGFREPRRVKLHYLMGDVSLWTEKYLEDITDEAIADYYERNKRLEFVRTPDMATEADEGVIDEKTAEEKSANEPPKEDSEEIDEATKPETTESNSSNEATTSEAPDEEETPSQENQSSNRRPAKNAFRLVSSQASETTSEEAAETESDPKSDSEVEEKAEGKASNESSAGESTDDTDGPPVEFDPLEDVSDIIRRRLAQDKAVVELQQVVEQQYKKLQKAYSPYGYEIVSAKSEGREPSAPPPELADLSKAAKATDLIYETTALLDNRQLAETDVGRAADHHVARATLRHRVLTDLALFEPALGRTIDGTWYLALKIEDQPSRVPELEEIREEVVDAWKLREARKLAQEAAEKYAEEAQANGETLAGFMAGKGFEVVTTDMFSWLTFGTSALEAQRGARLGDAPPLEAVGYEFMSKAFGLEPDQVASVMSYNQSQAFVIRLDRRERTREELRELYLAEGDRWYASPYGESMTAARWQSIQSAIRRQLFERVELNFDEYEEAMRRERLDDE